MAAIARELNITVHMVKKVRDNRRGKTVTRAEATAQVLRICHEWDNDRLTELENRYAHLGEKVVYERDIKKTSKIPEYLKIPARTSGKRARYLHGLTKTAKNQI